MIKKQPFAIVGKVLNALLEWGGGERRKNEEEEEGEKLFSPLKKREREAEREGGTKRQFSL